VGVDEDGFASDTVDLLLGNFVGLLSYKGKSENCDNG
jgi:hypothetical protein